MTALPIALAAALATGAEPPEDVDAQGAALSRELDQMALVLGAGAVLSALDAPWA